MDLELSSPEYLSVERRGSRGETCFRALQRTAVDDQHWPARGRRVHERADVAAHPRDAGQLRDPLAVQ